MYKLSSIILVIFSLFAFIPKNLAENSSLNTDTQSLEYQQLLAQDTNISNTCWFYSGYGLTEYIIFNHKQEALMITRGFGATTRFQGLWSANNNKINVTFMTMDGKRVSSPNTNTYELLHKKLLVYGQINYTRKNCNTIL